MLLTIPFLELGASFTVTAAGVETLLCMSGLQEPVVVTRASGRLDVMVGIADYSGSLVLQLPLSLACHVACHVTSALI